jgi:hypothetical protein
MILRAVRAADLDLGAEEAFRLGLDGVVDESFGLDVQPATLGGVERAFLLGTAGQPTCSIRPARSTTILSASVIASTWSWVT